MTATPKFIAHSRAMRGLVEQIRRFAATDANVLIAGETGTGKNAIATEIHARGPRARLPFVTIDCAALTASLIDSELFGHERGAYTDAIVARPGRFELAGGGTVYLDAVTELPLEAQGKLLRIVEEKRVERLGSHTSVTVGARVVASAEAGIEDGVRAGRFRHDLYHRLRVLPLFVPPLRDRRDDILPLVRHFLKRLATAARRQPPAFTRETASALADYAWPGNIRELRHARGNQTEAARLLGISRKALWEKRKRYGLE
jgi:DNA-binding NtrC family response regulator